MNRMRGLILQLFFKFNGNHLGYHMYCPLLKEFDPPFFRKIYTLSGNVDFEEGFFIIFARSLMLVLFPPFSMLTRKPAMPS